MEIQKLKISVSSFADDMTKRKFKSALILLRNKLWAPNAFTCHTNRDYRHIFPTIV